MKKYFTFNTNYIIFFSKVIFNLFISCLDNMANRIVASIVCNEYCGFNAFSMSISSNGDVYSVGSHSEGAHGQKENFTPLQKIGGLTNIVSIDCGEIHSICLDIDGNVFTFGNNEFGQLGRKIDTTYTHIPQKLTNIPPITQISCGSYFNVCLSNEGDLYSFGQNKYGQLGLGSVQQIFYSPQKIKSLSDIDIDFIECGNYFTYCKTLSGKVYVWGINFYGELGLGTTVQEYQPIECSDIPNNIVDIKCGALHTLILTSDQEVYSCGAGDEGQLGRALTDRYSAVFKKVDDISVIIRIECGSTISMCIDIYNNLFVFGFNESGQLGLSDTQNRYRPVKYTYLSPIIDISSKGNHTFVKTSENEIYGFGDNSFEQLGTATEDEFQTTPIRVFEGNEDIWFSNINKSKAKSARK